MVLYRRLKPSILRYKRSWSSSLLRFGNQSKPCDVLPLRIAAKKSLTYGVTSFNNPASMVRLVVRAEARVGVRCRNCGAASSSCGTRNVGHGDLRIDSARAVAAAGVNGASEENSLGTACGDANADGLASDAGKGSSRGRFRSGVCIEGLSLWDLSTPSFKTLAG